MPKAVKGSSLPSPSSKQQTTKFSNISKGTLVECDPSIKTIIMNIDGKENNEYVIEDLDETHLMIKDVMVAKLKARLEERLKETVPIIEDESSSDREKK
ncbi:transcription factor TFIIH complex subunit Tfb5-domain-containing protein [Xylariaceae sp. FL0255]|nr:transcription factor TFIIH complex subunit Tfb5-domain-containing protein [Xylariaceae sp. FL0255]